MCRSGKRKKRKSWRLAGALLSLAGIGVFSIYMVMIALAAPENPAAQWVKGAASAAEDGSGSDTMLREDGAGGDTVLREGSGGSDTVPQEGGSGDSAGLQENGGGSDAASQAGGAGSDTGQQESGNANPAAVPGSEEAASEDARTASAQAYRKDPDVPLIAVDPGHGGIDEGCSSAGVLEKDINLSIAVLLKQRLEDLGYQVLMIRDSDSCMAKEERAELANLCRADVYISIHQDTCEDGSVSGIETWYDGADAQRDSGRLARLVHKYAQAKTNARDRGLKNDADFCVTGKTQMPACLIETGFLSHSSEREQLQSLEYQEKLAAGIAEGIDLFLRPKTMYLTFDDGPSPQNTNAVLDILKEKNIKATFFLVGENVRKYPEVAKRIAAEGHTIGIHCNSHAYDKIYASADSYVEDFEEAYQTVLEVTGVEAKLFRFPGGSVNAYNEDVREAIVEEMTSRGFLYYDWNASLEDAVKNTTPRQLIENAVSSTLGRRKVVMLAHDVVDNTVLCLSELLEQFPEYEMKPLTEWVEPIQFPM